MIYLWAVLLGTASSSAIGDTAKVYESGGEKFKYEILTNQKDVIWGFDFLERERLLFSERGGALRVLDLKSKKVDTLEGSPQVGSKGQGGMLDVRVHPKESSKVYFTYSESSKQGLTTALGVATLEGNKLTKFSRLFSAKEPTKGGIHFGSRIEFDGQGHLWISVGDRNERDLAQNLMHHNGKIIRLKEDGSIPLDNPFVKDKKARPEVWSYGHRNPQGLVYDPEKKQLWSTEFGPKGGDELNLIEPGANYGWPIITYGREYYGLKIGEGAAKEGLKQPFAHWVPSISPSAIGIYTGAVFPKWKGQFFLATLSGVHLRRLKMDQARVGEQDELLKELGIRFRNVRTGPDGFLYFSTDDGMIARLVRP
jgi:glucose/arabinose dehydrogenase